MQNITIKQSLATVALLIHYDVNLELLGLYGSEQNNGNFHLNGTTTVEFVLNNDPANKDSANLK